MKLLPKIAFLATVSTLALTGTASAAVPGLELNFLQSASNSNPSKPLQPKCSTGKVALQGGGRIAGGLGQVTFDGFVPINFVPRTLVQTHEDGDGFAGNWSTQAFSVCSNPLPGYELVRLDGPSGSFNRSMLIGCKTGKQLIGANAEIVGSVGRATFSELAPHSVDNFAVTVEEIPPGFPSSWRIVGYAVCVDPLPGYELITADSDFNSFSAKSVAANCSPGKRLLGGGAMVDEDGRAVLKEMRPTATSMVVSGEEAQGGTTKNWLARAYAICATP